MPAAVHILAVLLRQGNACNGVDEQQRVPAHKALAAQVVKGLQRLEEGQPFDLVQCPCSRASFIMVAGERSLSISERIRAS